MSEGQVLIVNQGDSVVLDCSFRASEYNLFDYPVLWRKTQRDEETQVNIMSSINEPFVASNRFEVTFTAQIPRYKLELSILGEIYCSGCIIIILKNHGVLRNKNNNYNYQTSIL